MMLRNLFLLCACLALSLAGCIDRDEFAGKYETSPSQEHYVRLELEPDGKGQWITDMDAFSLQWEQRDGDVWLHTRNGGVIKAHPRPQGLTLRIPGTEPLELEKISG
ncbi:MAG: hypothetical protein ACLFTB_06250 [Desulfovibrionales bacterium]